jgi:hypothetical protein
MEKLPKFEVIGDVPEKEKADYIARKRDIFEKQERILPEDDKLRKEIENAEYTKTPEQIAILNFINEETNRLMKECGVEPFDIPIENYHILPEKELKKFFDAQSSGTYSSRAYAIGLSSDLRSNLLWFATVAFHESLHMKAREVAQLYRGEEGKYKEKRYRAGIKVFSPHQKDINGNSVTHFSGADEGVIAWQEKINFSKLLELPELAEERKEYESEKSEIFRSRISLEKEIPEDEIICVNQDGTSWQNIGYPEQRKVLEYVCEEISKELKDKYPSKEDVFREFLKATFNGNLIVIARLMKQTFGGKGLRALGMMKTGKNNIVNNVLEMLRGMRRDTLHESQL